MFSKTSWWIHAAYISVAIFWILQIGYQRENLGYYSARIEECGKIVNSDNYANNNMKVPLTLDERWKMMGKCEAMANADFKKNNVWFWNAPKHQSHYGELWHY